MLVHDPVALRLPLYEGRGFPLGSLSPHEFEQFIFASLQCIEESLGLRITGAPSGPGDGGFDVQGSVIRTKRLACVQCKRQNEPLDSSQVAKELAKVAATSMLEGSNIGEHRFICTGGVRNSLRKQLREASVRQLAAAAGEQLATATHSELASLRAQLKERGEDPRQVAEAYVQGLDVLLAWDIDEFDAALSARWDDALEVAGRFFRIATVVREHPRAVFDRAAYFAAHQNYQVIVEPRLANTSLPEGMTTVAAGDPPTGSTHLPKAIKSMFDLLQLEAGELAILLGDGGVGKSTVLTLLRAQSMRMSASSTLPVLISLAHYVPGSLDRFIHEELGVDHGSWRSLPDKVVLLCDGLNECESAHVAAFLGELKPLLQRGRIACVLSTRGWSKHTRVALPHVPVACAEVQRITPKAILRIAEHQLVDGSSAEFVTAYRLLADKSGSPQLWTPFAVLTALDIWQRNTTLPPTLGAMLAALLRSRCNRDAVSPVQPWDPEVILHLAGALAFESLVVEKRLGCPSLGAGEWIRKAKLRCEGALGIADMTETAVVALLTQHELLRVSVGGYLNFGHQMLAGALAAPVLARVWQAHAASLGETVADDAWVFAARLIPHEHIQAYLETVFNMDLKLGARAARELLPEFHTLAERLIDKAIDATSPEPVRVQGIFALAILGTPNAIAKLRELAIHRDSDLHFATQQARAFVGDLNYLRPLLHEVDRMKSGPATVSGGEVAIWEAAPLAVRLDLARERLTWCAPGSPVAESLWLLGYEADAADSELITKHFWAAANIRIWQLALSAIHRISPILARELLGKALLEAPSCPKKAEFIRFAVSAGVDVDLQLAFECAIVELTEPDPGSQSNHELEDLISDVISKSALPPNLIAQVEDMLPHASGKRRRRLWQLACQCRSAKLAAYSVSRIRARDPDFGYACNFFMGQFDLAQDRKLELIDLCEAGLGDERTWYDWHTFRALELLGRLGFTSKAARYLEAMVQRLTRLRRALESNEPDSVLATDAQVLASTKPEHALIHVGRLAAQLLPAAAQARALLPLDIKLSLLYFDGHWSGAMEHQRQLFADVGDQEIDHALISIENTWALLSSLAVVCARGATDIRIRLLASEISKNYGKPASMTLLSQAVDACWCQAVCRMVVTTVSQIPIWTRNEAFLFSDFVDMVTKHIGPSDQHEIEIALADVKTSFSRDTLETWHAKAMGRRIGLAGLEVKGD
ncbi:MAG: hypothetical protein WAW73_07095 [Rhodoferax sp.]